MSVLSSAKFSLYIFFIYIHIKSYIYYYEPAQKYVGNPHRLNQRFSVWMWRFPSLSTSG